MGIVVLGAVFVDIKGESAPLSDNCFDLVPRMEGVEVIGASSDHTILDVENVKDKIHVGDVLEFGIKAYGPMAYLTHSDGVRVVCKGGKANT